jgi:hypothetical protein
MNRCFSFLPFSFLLLMVCVLDGFCGGFDERFWEKYAEIHVPFREMKDNLLSLRLDPGLLGDMTAKTPFADLRVVTDQKEEVAWQLMEKRPGQWNQEIPHRMQNYSLDTEGETWLELLLLKPDAGVNTLDVITPDKDFSRQVQVFGSEDGKKWNTVRKDAVIFDFHGPDRLRRTRITFPQTRFPYLALKIKNSGVNPLHISDVRVWRESVEPGQMYTIRGKIEQPEVNSSRKENSIMIRMNKVFPVDQLTIHTKERNFRRAVEVQVKRDTGDWKTWARGIIFHYDTEEIQESQTRIEMPPVAAEEFRLVFHNLDSPPLSVHEVTGSGYQRFLIFKHRPDRKMYLFWGNPLAEKPQYDLSGIMKTPPLNLPAASLGQTFPNSKFEGRKARLPFTERYKYLLHFFVILGIAGLIYLQYRVFRRI